MSRETRQSDRLPFILTLVCLGDAAFAIYFALTDSPLLALMMFAFYAATASLYAATAWFRADVRRLDREIARLRSTAEEGDDNA